MGQGLKPLSQREGGKTEGSRPVSATHRDAIESLWRVVSRSTLWLNAESVLVKSKMPTGLCVAEVIDEAVRFIVMRRLTLLSVSHTFPNALADP